MRIYKSLFNRKESSYISTMLCWTLPYLQHAKKLVFLSLILSCSLAIQFFSYMSYNVSREGGIKIDKGWTFGGHSIVNKSKWKPKVFEKKIAKKIKVKLRVRHTLRIEHAVTRIQDKSMQQAEREIISLSGSNCKSDIRAKL